MNTYLHTIYQQHRWMLSWAKGVRQAEARPPAKVGPSFPACIVNSEWPARVLTLCIGAGPLSKLQPPSPQ